MLKIRMFGEQIIDRILAGLRIEVDRFATQDDKIKILRNTKINGAIPDLFDIVRRYGNKANHDAYENKKDALECLVSMYKISAWFYIKITKDTSIKPLTYKIPEKKTNETPVYNIEEYEKEKGKEEHTKEVNEVKEKITKVIETKEDKKIEKEVEETL